MKLKIKGGKKNRKTNMKIKKIDSTSLTTTHPLESRGFSTGPPSKSTITIITEDWTISFLV